MRKSPYAIYAARSLPLLCLAVYAAAASIGALSGGLWAGLAIGFALLLFFAVWSIDGKPSLPPRGFALFVTGVLALFAAELPFSFALKLSLHQWANVAGTFLPLLLLTAPRLRRAALPDAAALKRFALVTALAAVLGAWALSIDLQSGGVFLVALKGPHHFVTEYNRGVAHLSLLAFPILAALWLSGGEKDPSGKYAAVIIVLILIFPDSLTESHTAKLALLAGLLCACIAAWRPRLVQYALAAAAIGVAGWPFYARWLFAARRPSVEQWHNSWRHRMEIWDYLSFRIGERPLIGWGLNTTHLLDFSRPHGDWYEAVVHEGAPHAHNFITELWVETGLPGLVCGIAFALWMLWRTGQCPPRVRPFALGCWAAAFLTAMFGFDFWTDALWGAFALSAFAFGMIEESVQRGDHVADIEKIKARPLLP